MTLEYHDTMKGMIFREVVRGKPRAPRRVRVTADHTYHVATVVIEGRGTHRTLELHRKHVIDPTRWVPEQEAAE